MKFLIFAALLAVGVVPLAAQTPVSPDTKTPAAYKWLVPADAFRQKP